jgi:16S rRNA (uracil1498-N3)-methyltransferase
MPTRRFYAPEITADFADFELDEVQSAHLRTVLRLLPGEIIGLFDGFGNEFECRIDSVKTKRTSVTVLKKVPPSSNESALKITLGVPLIKPSNAELIVKKAVELGISAVVPVVTEYCGIHARRFKKERWEKIVIESSKQCGRATLMTVSEKKDFERFVVDSGGLCLMFSESEGKSLPAKIIGDEITAVIGPEGGWSDNENKAAVEKGFSLIHFGGRILRAETAAIAICSILQHRYGDMN